MSANFCTVLRNVVPYPKLPKKLRGALSGATKVAFAKVSDAEGITRVIMAARKEDEEANNALSSFVTTHVDGIQHKPFGHDDQRLDEFYIEAVINMKPDEAMTKFASLKRKLQSLPA